VLQKPDSKFPDNTLGEKKIRFGYEIDPGSFGVTERLNPEKIS